MVKAYHQRGGSHANLDQRPLKNFLRASPAYLGDFVSDLAVIPAQTTRDFVYPDAANEHLAQRVHLRIRPLSAGIHGQRFVICLGPPAD